MKITIDRSFNYEQRKIIQKCLDDVKSKLVIGDNLTLLEIKNSGRLKTTAGNARTVRNKKLGIIKMNKRLFSSTAGLTEFNNTFTHELAHILVNFIEGVNCSHNHKWKAMHKLLGGNAKTTHNYEVDHLRPKKNTYAYKCGCAAHKLSAVRHNKILRGASFSCKRCKVKIKRIV